MLRRPVARVLASAVLMGTIALGGCAQPGAQADTQSGAQPAESANEAQNREALYQVSLLQGLTEGDFEGSVTVGDLKKHGDTGIGTFDGLNGELVMLDGEVWQAAGDGSVNLMEDAATIPFGNVTFLDSDETVSRASRPCSSSSTAVWRSWEPTIFMPCASMARSTR